jgi:hypothetical protein
LGLSYSHHMLQAVFADHATTAMLTRESLANLYYQVSRVVAEG